MKLTTIIIWFSLIGLNGFSQTNEQLIDPINYECFRLTNNKIIEPLKLDEDYFGRVILDAECDTINGILKNHKLVFAKLRSKTDSNDSIEIRLDFKIGNYKFIEKYMDTIIEHISGLRIERNPVEKCVYVPKFMIPFKIESKK